VEVNILIICVTDRLHCQGNFLKRIEQIAKALPHSIILREKDLQPNAYEQLVLEVLKICDRYNVPFVLNSHINAANKIKVSNIHLPMEIYLKRRDELSSFKKIGVSVHSVDEAKLVESMGADYIIAGQIFSTDCKKGIPPRGLDFLQKVCFSVSIPVFAIGGINHNNINDVLKCGAEGICLMSQLMKCDDPEEVITSYRTL
jgi:thiamine-phosphate pyrophosphorylase